MNEKMNFFKRIENGSFVVSDKLKYMIVSLAVAFGHLIFLILFYISGVTPLFIYNIFIVLMYAYCGLIWSRKGKYINAFVFLIVEIMTHSVLATILTGWNPGFMIYTITLIPICFYASYTLEEIKSDLKVSLYTSLMISVIYMTMIVITRHSEPVSQINGTIEEIFFYLNNIIALAFLLYFAVLYVIEMRNMQRNLRVENVELEEQANYDKLTHLLNRNSMTKYFNDIIEFSELEDKNFCILMADIDDFKKVNDTYGHDCGDEVLKKIAAIITSDVRQGDLVFRWGGEEILVLIRSDLKVATNVAHRICNHVATSITKYEDNDIRVTITIGVAAFMKGMTADELVKQADVKLYYGKQHGKDQVVA
ncbi:MAG: GGDEF domain-containing protein [Lachnospiraceae bacterium]|nr:GGDEF domain-containing protein [Lachnospiraceae bacterium]